MAFEQIYNNSKDWLINFFQTIDQYETISVIAIALGVILLVTGLIML